MNSMVKEIEQGALKLEQGLETILEKLEMYKELLVEWNEKMNLTAIIDDYGIIVKHLGISQQT